jgi:hypothetical protein
MDQFSLIVLDNTLELAAKVMPSVDRVKEDVKVIRGYLGLVLLDPENAPEYVRKLHHAISDLCEAANQSRQFFIAGRLENIAHQLDREKRAS